MKTLSILIAALTLSACGSLTDPGSLNRKIDEATYKHYPNLSEAKRAECRAKAEPIYWGKAKGDEEGFARVAAGNAFEKCMES